MRDFICNTWGTIIIFFSVSSIWAFFMMRCEKYIERINNRKIKRLIFFWKKKELLLEIVIGISLICAVSSFVMYKNSTFIPDVRGNTYDSAKQTLQSLGVIVSSDIGDGRANFEVIDQEGTEGTWVKLGTEIKLILGTNIMADDVEYQVISNENQIIEIDSDQIQGLATQINIKMKNKYFQTHFGKQKAEITVHHQLNGGIVAYATIDNKEITFVDVIIDLAKEYNMLSEEGGFEGAHIQISPYDFDKDNVNELVIALCYRGSMGFCTVLQYKEDTNDFIQVGNFMMQQKVTIVDDCLHVPIGTQGLLHVYRYVNNSLVEQ